MRRQPTAGPAAMYLSELSEEAATRRAAGLVGVPY